VIIPSWHVEVEKERGDSGRSEGRDDEREYATLLGLTYIRYNNITVAMNSGGNKSGNSPTTRIIVRIINFPTRQHARKRVIVVVVKVSLL